MNSYFDNNPKNKQRLIDFLNKSYSEMEIIAIGRLTNNEKNDYVSSSMNRAQICEALIERISQKLCFDELFSVLKSEQYLREAIWKEFSDFNIGTPLQIERGPNTSDKDIKKLWGLAAGKCSFPNCGANCIPFLNEDSSTVIGEMAHIIARKSDGARGVAIGDNDNYDNLILLCPTHHTTIDKAPEGVYSVELIKDWKRQHEGKINNYMQTIRYSNKNEMAKTIKRLLLKNHKEWQEFGPESDRARKNPISNISEYWDLIKLSIIVPNNKKIMSVVEAHEDMFEIEEYAICIDFIVHAELFENSCYTIIEDTKRFPQKFTEVIDKYVYAK